MSKLSSVEKFFIGRISLGLDGIGDEMEKDDVEKLLSNGTDCSEEFKKRIKISLTFAYTKDFDSFKTKIITEDPTSFWNESVKRLLNEKENLLCDIVNEWYSKYRKPGFFDTLKGLFKK